MDHHGYLLCTDKEFEHGASNNSVDIITNELVWSMEGLIKALEYTHLSYEKNTFWPSSSPWSGVVRLEVILISSLSVLLTLHSCSHV